MVVAVRGGGEMASAAARLLFLSGFRVAVLEREQPLAVRRLVCFAEAVSAGACAVEGVPGRRVEAGAVEGSMAARAFVPVAVDPEGAVLRCLPARVVVDGRMIKTDGGGRVAASPLVVGLGPGFEAGRNAHAVVETQRGADLGRVLWSGMALADTATPALVEGVGEERVIRAPRAGVFIGSRRIGDVVSPGDVVGRVDGEVAKALVGGLLRGLVAEGTSVARDAKLGDVDPRGRRVDPARISDKARAVSAGVLEAVVVALGQEAS